MKIKEYIEIIKFYEDRRRVLRALDSKGWTGKIFAPLEPFELNELYTRVCQMEHKDREEFYEIEIKDEWLI